MSECIRDTACQQGLMSCAICDKQPKTARSKYAHHHCPECGAWTSWYHGLDHELEEVHNKEHDHGCLYWKDCE